VVNLWLPYGSQWRGSTPLKPEPLFGWVFGSATDSWQRTVWSLAITGVGLLVVRAGLRWAERPVTGAAPEPSLPAAQGAAPGQSPA
jgi:hypothetical protein